MPAHEDTPELLKTAIANMEHNVQVTKESLAYAAPELYAQHWAMLQTDLAREMALLYNNCKEMDNGS